MWRNLETQIISDRVSLVKKKKNVVLLSPDFTPDRHCHQLAGTVVGKTEANSKSSLYTFLPIFYQSQQSPGGGRVVQPDSLTTSKSLHLMTIWNQREKCFLSWKFFLLSFYKFNLKKNVFINLKESLPVGLRLPADFLLLVQESFSCQQGIHYLLISIYIWPISL